MFNIPQVKIGFLPETLKQDRMVDHLLEQWASQEVRRAVNRWIYSQEAEESV